MAKEFDRDSDRTSVARDFDGVDDTIDLGTVADSDQSLTFMSWVKPDTVTQSINNFRVVTKVDGDTFPDGSVGIDIQETGEPRAFAINGTTTTVADSATLSTNQFVHLASRYDFQTGELSLFRDGQLIGTNSVGQLPPFSSQPWRVGLDNPTDSAEKHLDGTADDTRIYTTALSDAEIRQIYRQTRPEQPVAPVASESLVAWYPFRRNSALDHTSLVDIPVADRTAYDATVNGATYKPSGGVTDIQTGANSGAFEFDGTDDTLDLGTVADSEQSLTFMIWVNSDVAGSERQRPITKNDGQSASKDGSFVLQISDDGSVVLYVTNNGTVTSIVSSQTVAANTYVHLCGRYDFPTGTAELYINGQSVGSASAGQLPPLSTQPWRIGQDNPKSAIGDLDGTADGTRIYQASLSDSQINQIYQNTKP